MPFVFSYSVMRRLHLQSKQRCKQDLFEHGLLSVTIDLSLYFASFRESIFESFLGALKKDEIKNLPNNKLYIDIIVRIQLHSQPGANEKIVDDLVTLVQKNALEVSLQKENKQGFSDRR